MEERSREIIYPLPYFGLSLFLVTGDSVTVDVEVTDEERSDPGEGAPSTLLIDNSSALLRSKYTLKLFDAHPPALMISDRVEPLLSIAVAAPLRKQWGEYRSESAIFSFSRTFRSTREKFPP